jgi:predicted GNAT family N-acyltransferase
VAKSSLFRIASDWNDLIKVFIVRGIVFIEEQDCIYREEIDEHEFGSIHILGEQDGQPIAAARIRFLGDVAKLERIAVRKAYRGKNHGHDLVEYMLQVSREHGFRKFKMHAQVYLRDFYAQHGFAVSGDIFQEAGIDHYLMVKEDSVTEDTT